MAESKQKSKQGGMAMLAVVVLLLSIVGAGSGFVAGSLLRSETDGKVDDQPAETPPAEPAHGAKEAPAPHGETPLAEDAPEEDEEEHVDLASLKIIPIPPVLTTLAEPKGKWIRLEGSIMATQGGELSPEMLAEKSGEQILGYLRTLRLDQIEGPSGLQALRADLNETVKVLSKGEVQGVLIHGLIVE